MSPFVKKQVLPRVVGIIPLAIGYWLGGIEGVVRAVGLTFAAGNVFLISVLWRPSARVRRDMRLYVFTLLSLSMTVLGLTIAGPLAPWILANIPRH